MRNKTALINKSSQPDNLRKILNEKSFVPIPSCFDSLSAKLVEQTNFDVTQLIYR
tara:strand:+ start:66 stop:230 length:165 start_codon:yes stop_codon:yes gene_type:complete